METRANYVLVGIFTVVVLVISFGFVYWSANVSDQDSRTALLVRIEGSVSGLSQGSQVLFNGLNVGTVTNLRIDPNNPRVVIATTQVDRTTPVTTSTTANIGFQGLTGIGFIGLTGGNMNDRNVIETALEQGATPIITADPSDVTDILATARDIADRANNILGEFEELVQAVGPAVRTTANNVAQTSGNVQTFTASLAANADQIDDFIGSLSRLSVSANNVAERLPGLLDQASEFVSALNVGAINQSIENVASITGSVRGQTDNIVAAVESITAAASSFGSIGDAIQQNTPSIQTFLSRLGPISDTASSVATRLDTTLGNVSEITAAVNPDQVRTTIGNVTSITDAVRGQTENFATAVESVTSAASSFGSIGETVRANTPSIDTFLSRLGPISDTATSVATRLDTTLGDVNEITAAVDPEQIRSTIGNVSGFSDALNQQSGKIGSVVSGADTVLATLNGALSGLNGTRARVDDILAGINSDDIGRAVNNVSSATTNIASAADSVRGIADGIGARRGDIDDIISNAEDTSANLKVASAQVQGLINSVNGLVNSPDGKGLTAEARATLQSIRQTAETIQAAVGPISANLQNFSGQGLQEVRNLIRDTTRAVSRIEGAVTDLSNNPSRILFGGDGAGEVRQFDGRARR